MLPYVTRALVIREPWIDLIISGHKTWEMRSRTTNIRGWIGLIRKGSSQIVGVAKLEGAGKPLDETEMLASVDRHRIPPTLVPEAIAKGWNTPWHLSNAHALDVPVPYIHKSGAVTFVSLDEDVALLISEHLGRVTDVSNAPVTKPRQSKPDNIQLGDARKAAEEPKLAEPLMRQGEGSKRLLGTTQITPGNLKNNHFYLRGFLEKFPEDLLGGRDRQPPYTAIVTGDRIAASETDICPRHRFFRDRTWTRRFFSTHDVRAGDHLRVFDTAPRMYRVELL